MNILIIGSGGQLGTDCQVVLRDAHQLTAIDYPAIDIGQRDSIAAVLDEVQPEVIINCAAYTAVDRCETEKEAAWKINADGPRYIAEAIAATDCRFIHVSTDYVFDGCKTVPEAYKENDPVNPLSEYGKSKLAGEQAVQTLLPKAVILRTAWLYSAHGPNFLKTMLRLALSDPHRNFTIVNDQFGSLTWSHTLARQIERLLTTSLAGVIHTTSNGYSSWYEAACYFLDKMAVPHSFVPCATSDYPTPAHRPANSILANEVLEKNGVSVFRAWQEDVDTFIGEHRAGLITETRKQLGQADE